MIKKINSIFVTTLSIGIFILSLYFLVFGTIARNNNELLNVFGYSMSVVPTNSMEGGFEDSIKKGSLIITKKVSYESINVGDIIVFQDNNILKVHRVIDITENGLITKGDNPNAYTDPLPTTIDNYQAKVIKTFSLFGIGSYVPGMQVIVLFILMVFLFILLIVQIIKLMKIKHTEKINKIKKELTKLE